MPPSTDTGETPMPPSSDTGSAQFARLATKLKELGLPVGDPF